MGNPLIDVQKFGQSIWYDNIRRGLITSGELYQMVEREGLLGVTSNPAIFTAAITGSNDYDQATRALVARGVGTAVEIYTRQLAGEDIQLAADVLYPVYVRTNRVDGYISFEVSPYLANDTKGTIEEARRLHKALSRENVLIKVPATPAGVPAIRQLISEGISVNVTLLFAVEAYEAVAEAYMSGLEGPTPTRAVTSARSPASPASSGQPHRLVDEVDSKLEKSACSTAPPDSERCLQEAQEHRRQGGHRQCENRLRPLQGAVRLRPLEGPARQKGHAAAAAVGQHQHEKPQVPQDDLRRRADRRGDGQHRSRRHVQGFPRVRQGPAEPVRELVREHRAGPRESWPPSPRSASP